MNKKWLVLLALAIFTFTACGSSGGGSGGGGTNLPIPDPNYNSFEGFIMGQSEPGSAEYVPLPNATVTMAGLSAVTDADGNFKLDHFASGSYTPEISRSGFILAAADRKNFSFTGSDKLAGSFNLTAVSQPANENTLQGTITGETDLGTGRYVALCYVEVSCGDIKVKTNEKGVFKVFNISNGTQTAKIEPVGFESQTQAVVFTGDTHVTFSPQLIRISWNDNTFSGTVYGETSRGSGKFSPLAGATVTIGSNLLTVTTGSDGTYSLDHGIPNGTYLVSASKSGYKTKSQDLYWNGSTHGQYSPQLLTE